MIYAGREATGSSGVVTGSLPGEVLWTYYNTTDIGGPCASTSFHDPDGCNVGGVGDNIPRLINSNGAANGNLAGLRTQTFGAIIYLLDDAEELASVANAP